MENIFIITKKDSEKIKYGDWLLKFVKHIKSLNDVKIHTHIGCQDTAKYLIGDVLGIGGWVVITNGIKVKVNCQNKEDKRKKYTLELYEFEIKRDIHNQLKN